MRRASGTWRGRFGMDFVHVYDNSTCGLTPSVLLQAESGEVVYLAEDIPDWLAIALG